MMLVVFSTLWTVKPLRTPTLKIAVQAGRNFLLKEEPHKKSPHTAQKTYPINFQVIFPSLQSHRERSVKPLHHPLTLPKFLKVLTSRDDPNLSRFRCLKAHTPPVILYLDKWVVHQYNFWLTLEAQLTHCPNLSSTRDKSMIGRECLLSSQGKQHKITILWHN